MGARGDTWYLINSVRRLRLSSDWFVINRGGLGAPTVEWITNENSRIGQRVLGYRIPPRLISLTLYHRSVLTPTQYYNLRQQLIEMINPLNSDPMYLEVHLANGEKRRLDIRYDSGAEFQAQSVEELMQYNINTQLSFIAHDPFFYNPNAESYSFTATEIGQLFIPFEFPIEFSGAGISFVSDELNYVGANLWRTFPRIIIYGPYTTATITNEATGASFQLIVPIENETRVIDMQGLTRVIYNELLESKFNELSDDSQLLNFYIEPNLTEQRIRISLSGAQAGVSSAAIVFNRRYFGI